jgi:hypothetical protein
MSTVMSQDGSSIWIMAWLDELPKSAADVPRTALLRLLSDNDKLGKGKFFAYIAPNRRFVLQRVIPNENITAATFKAALDDLGQSVVGTHAHGPSPTGLQPQAKIQRLLPAPPPQSREARLRLLRLDPRLGRQRRLKLKRPSRFSRPSMIRSLARFPKSRSSDLSDIKKQARMPIGCGLCCCTNQDLISPIWSISPRAFGIATFRIFANHLV